MKEKIKTIFQSDNFAFTVSTFCSFSFLCRSSLLRLLFSSSSFVRFSFLFLLLLFFWSSLFQSPNVGSHTNSDRYMTPTNMRTITRNTLWMWKRWNEQVGKKKTQTNDSVRVDSIVGRYIYIYVVCILTAVFVCLNCQEIRRKRFRSPLQHHLFSHLRNSLDFRTFASLGINYLQRIYFKSNYLYRDPFYSDRK